MPPRPARAPKATTTQRTATSPAARRAAIARIALTKRNEKRSYLRFSNVFPVTVSSDLFGEFPAIARNISAGGMFIETPEPLPLGTEVRVGFSTPVSEAEISARGEVKGHYFFNYSDGQGGSRALCGMGVRFFSFEEDGEEVLGLSLTRMRSRDGLH